MDGIDLLRRVDVEDIKPGGELSEATPPSLYADHAYPGRAWATAIDLSSYRLRRLRYRLPGREQHSGRRQGRGGEGATSRWLRIDRYQFGGDRAAYFQPVPCMHCENAPCEVVCPVNATVHDSEGLNVMVYNRASARASARKIVPYKVRRFNFLAYADSRGRPAEAQCRCDGWCPRRHEKCTDCIQRIRKAEIVADHDDRALGDGEVVTACQEPVPPRRSCSAIAMTREFGSQRKARPGDRCCSTSSIQDRARAIRLSVLNRIGCPRVDMAEPRWAMYLIEVSLSL